MLIGYVMVQQNINASKVDAFSPYSVTDKPFTVEVLLLNNMEEIWKDIEGYEGLYQISNLGNIKRFGHEFRVNDPKRKSTKKDKILSSTIDCCGYYHFVLSKNKKCKTHRNHREIAKCFIPNPQNKPHVNHINGIKTDNRIENLEWVTPLENVTHAINSGLMKKAVGEKASHSKLKEWQVIEIRYKYKTGKYTQNELSKEYGIYNSGISGIVNYKYWKHIR